MNIHKNNCLNLFSSTSKTNIVLVSDKMNCSNFMVVYSLCYQYVTLFASAFPLAAAVSIVFLFIEGRADLFKLLYVYQRPRVRRYGFLVTVKL